MNLVRGPYFIAQISSALAPLFEGLRSASHAGKIAALFLEVLKTARWGRLGFDGGNEIKGACREGSDSRKSIAATFIVANEDNYALAA